MDKKIQKPKMLVSGVNIINDILIMDTFVKELRKDFDIILTTFSHHQSVRKKAKEEGVLLYELPGYNKKDILPKKFLEEELLKIEKKINYPIQKLLFADPELYSLYQKNGDSALTWFVRIFKLFEIIIEKNDVRHCFPGGDDRIYNLLPYFITKSSGGEVYLIRPAPYMGIFITSNAFTNERKNKIITKNIDYDKYVQSIKDKPTYFVEKVNYSKYWSFLKIIKKVYESVYLSWNDRKNLYIERGMIKFKDLLLYFPKNFRRNMKKFCQKKLIYKKPNFSERYVYYPLNYLDDAQIRLKYPEGYNQYELVENIAKNLPAGYKLLVKEHPFFAGNYSYKELKSLSKRRNILFVNPKMSSKEIFNYSDYVISTSSTVGYEALFYDKVVLLFGFSFFDDFPGIIKLKAPEEIFSILTNKNLIQKKKQNIKEKLKEKTIEFLRASIEYDYQKFFKDGQMQKIADYVRILSKR
jgi:hypothetical protein